MLSSFGTTYYSYFAFIFLQYISSIEGFYGGTGLCPFQLEKFVPCKVKNGSESYVGQNICWKSLNGSHSCTKRILQRPKYITTFKKVYETRYKCCPGLYGHGCNTECFNCSTIKNFEARLEKIEETIVLQNNFQQNDHRNRHRHNHYSHIVLDSNVLNNNETYDELKTSTNNSTNEKYETKLIRDIRELEVRVQNLESELSRLLELLNNKSKLNEKGTGAIIDEDPNVQRLKSSQSSPRVSSSSSPSPRGLGVNSNTSINELLKNVFKSTSTNPHLHKSSSQAQIQEKNQRTNYYYKKTLEDNLERGDIASTLNDDYDEDLNLSASYEDQLYNVINQ